MLQAIQNTKLWFKVDAFFSHNNKPVQLRVHICDDSISHSFLVIEDFPGSQCFIPITSELSPSFSIADKLFSLQFARYCNITLCFKFNELIDIEQMVSHFGKSSLLINPVDDVFMAENLAFLRRVKPNEPTKLIPQIDTMDAMTGLLPITSNAPARDLWEKCVRSRNSHFYIKEVPMCFNFMTWNVASNEATNDVIDDLVKVFRVPSGQADVVVIALEEIDMSFKSVVTGNSINAERWTEYIRKAQAMAGNDSYDIAAYDSMGGVYCCALVRKNLNPPIKESFIQTKKLGANGMLANKAAVFFRWNIGETSLVAICCHLAAHDQNWEQRNSQWHEIVEDMKDIDYIIFMGDLNYRIAMTYEECIEKIGTKSYEELYEKDQLHMTQITDKIIGSFKEPEIRFNPTFKFDINSDQYDTSPKHRVPSWTDRILLRTAPKRISTGLSDDLVFETDAVHHFINNPGLFLTDNFAPITVVERNNFPRPPKCICYRALKSSFSDHRPVQASYRFQIPLVDESRKEELNQIITAKFDEIRLLTVPSFVLKNNTIETSILKEQEVDIENSSLVWVEWKIRKESIPPGVTVTPLEGVLFLSQKDKIIVKCSQPLKEEKKITVYAQKGKSLSIKLMPQNSLGFKIDLPDVTFSVPISNPFSSFA